MVVEAVDRTTAEMWPRPCAGDGSARRDRPGWDAVTLPVRVMAIWPAIGGSGATPAGAVPAEAGGAGSDWGEWGYASGGGVSRSRRCRQRLGGVGRRRRH